MKYFRISMAALLLGLLVCLPTLSCIAEVTRLIEYNGKLSRSNGSPYPTGIYDVVFDICTDIDCSETLWTEIHTIEISGRNKKLVDDGTNYDAAFSVNKALDSEKLGGQVPSYYAIATHAHDFSEIAGTISDTQVPDNITINNAINAGYASISGNADTVDGHHASSFAPASHSHSEYVEKTEPVLICTNYREGFTDWIASTYPLEFGVSTCENIFYNHCGGCTEGIASIMYPGGNMVRIGGPWYKSP